MYIRYNKYGNRKTYIDGIKFDSQKEASRWIELKLLETAGKIHGLQRQVKYELIPAHRKKDGKLERAAYYFADFQYEKDGNLIVEDSKGMRTKEYILKRKLMLDRYGIEIKEV
ncbi:MAG: DUF1064 domain-containing protein [Fibrobacter sp.]|nr:DUF1064 domain-containing protein [Fibrobacter sp.]